MDLIKTRKQLGSGRTIHDLPLRVAYYARVSSDKDEQLNSLDNQITYFDGFIKGNKNWGFAGGYIDEGLSGSSVKKRDNFLRMIADGEKGIFDLVVTKEISRFARDTLDSIQYTRQLLFAGVGVFFQADNICTLDLDSELRLTIMASLAQDELRRLSERVKFGMKQAYKNGKVMGQDNIYGYNKANGKLVVNEKEADFIRELFTLYAEDKYGFRVLTRLLTEKGYRNQTGEELNPGSLKGILTNPKYKGFYHGHITESSDYREQKKVKTATEDRLLYKSEEVPAIVSEELWDRVNTIVSRRSEKFGNVGYGSVARFPYSGKIICEEHGTHHYRKVWKDRKIPTESWCCKEYLAKGRKACATPHIYTRDLDAIMKYIGNDLLSNREKYVQSVENLLAMYERAEKNPADLSSEIAKASNAIKKNKSKQDKLIELYTDDEIDKADYLEKNARLKSDTEKLNQQLSALQEEQSAAGNANARLANVKNFFATLTDNNEGALYVAQQMLESVTILRGSTKKEMKIRITMRYGDIIPCTIIMFGNTEVSPLVGSEKQSEDLINYINQEMSDEPGKIWELNMFGKSMHEMVRDGLQNKLFRMPETAQMKFQETLQRLINEGSGGLICIIL
ncbi:MAG: recombinase family protein [Defluviitaleaceae bacterium]|nr:recombinase family protein [Defluviitaleaceae bacterium]MCL2262862.1 recombinase family protein [Defluviitaleaceae bacterium]